MDRRASRTWLPALLVLLITAGVALGSGTSEAPADEATPTPVSTSLAADDGPDATIGSVFPTRAVDLSPTPRPTDPPLPPPSPTAEPAEPAAERAPPPPTGLDDRALIVERGGSGRLEIALTFDAGEGPGYTEEILDLLAERSIKASFGVTGQWAEQNPELIRRMVAEGHMLINHTYDHRSWTGASPSTAPLTDEERRDELRRTEQVVRDIAGYELAPYFRFPYGDYDPASLSVLKEEGYDYALWWTCDTLAWMGGTPQEIAQRCAPDDPTAGGAGAVILMHVAQEADWNALPAVIGAYGAAGYDFVTMEQLVQP